MHYIQICDKMKIVHLIFDFNVGGTETMLVDIVNEQSKCNDVTIVIINDCYDSTLIASISQRVHIKFIHRQPKSRNPLYFAYLNLWLSLKKPDIVHYHNYVTPKVLLPIFKLFSTVHALGIPPTYFKRCKCLFAISESVRNDILSHGEYPVSVVPNGIDVERISPRSINRLRLPFRIVQIARLEDAIKGQDILIKGIGYLKRKGISNVELDLIGEGESLTSLKSLANKEQVGDVVHFLGKKSRDFIYSHLCGYDLMCHPSRTEGFGLTVAEGMAAKVPVLVPDSDGPYDIIGHGKHGQVFKKNDIDDFCHRLMHIYENYDQIFTPEAIAEAYTHVLNNYSLQRMVKCYSQVYGSFLDN